MSTTTNTTSYRWLTARTRNGARRIETLSWGRLNRIYHARSTTPAVRYAIEHEARRRGYRPHVILTLNAWK